MKRHILLILHLTLFLTALATGNSTIDRIAYLRETADSLHSVGRTDSAVIVGEEAIELAKESKIPTLIVGTHSA